MKKTFLILTIALISLTAGGCKKDDAISIDPSQLVGKWELTASYDGEYDSWDYEWGAAYNDIYYHTFNADGSGVYTRIQGSRTSNNKFTYSIAGNLVTVKHDVAPRAETYTVNSITATEFNWTTEEYRNDDGEGPYRDQNIFKRIQ